MSSVQDHRYRFTIPRTGYITWHRYLETFHTAGETSSQLRCFIEKPAADQSLRKLRAPSCDAPSPHLIQYILRQPSVDLCDRFACPGRTKHYRTTELLSFCGNDLSCRAIRNYSRNHRCSSFQNADLLESDR